MIINIDNTEAVRHLILIFGALLSSFILTLLFIKPFLRMIEKFKFGKQIRSEAVDGGSAPLFQELHAKKGGTPTMAGILIWGIAALIIFITHVLSLEPFDFFNNSLWNRQETYLPVFTLITVGIVGFFDDLLNITSKNKGMKPNLKMFLLIFLSLLGGWWFHYKLGYNAIDIPVFGSIHLGVWYIPFFILVLISTANSVNLTDGLDGLAGGLLIIAFSTFCIISYINGLLILCAFCALIVGSLIAFLWFNIPPAKFYMGDTGSLSLGATLGVIALMTNSIIPLILTSIVFIIETLSVIIQLTSKKLFKRKVFHIAPIHHHFEYIGWPEHTITMRFWIIGSFSSILAILFAILKIL